MSAKLFIHRETGEASLNKYFIINRHGIVATYGFWQNKEAHTGVGHSPRMR